MKIRLNEMIFYGFHGAHPAEQTLGQRFTVNIELQTDDALDQSIETLDDTIDYTLVYDEVKAQMEGTSFALLETCANRILDNLMATHADIKCITISIQKPSVPIRGTLHSAEVELTRCR